MKIKKLFPAVLGHFAAEDVKAKLQELHNRWDGLKGKATQRRQDLEDSLQAQQYFADANEAESWMREKEPIVGSTDYGKDEDSAEVNKEGIFWVSRPQISYYLIFEQKMQSRGKKVIQLLFWCSFLIHKMFKVLNWQKQNNCFVVSYIAVQCKKKWIEKK